MNFGEAVESLAQRFGVVLEYNEPETEQKGQARASQRSLLEASRFYHFLHLHTAAGSCRPTVFVDRGISLEFVRALSFRIFATFFGIIVPSMHAKGFNNELLEAAGLIRVRDTGSVKELL